MQTIKKEHISQPQINALSLGRLLIPELIPESRVLYLDSDITINGSLDESFQINLENFPIAAVPDVVYLGDFNAGVLILNNCRLNTIQPNIVDQMLKFGQRDDFVEGDQSALNHFFNQNYYQLTYKNNYVIGFDF